MTEKSTAIIRKEGRWFIARSLELGVTTQGKTVEEATKNLREAVELYLEGTPKRRSALTQESPLITSIDIHRG